MTSIMPTFPVEGGCACGAVRYRLTEDPIGLHVCHCTDCQRVSGSAFVMSMPAHRRSVELLRGNPATVSFETPGGIHRRDRRCNHCGCRVWNEIEGAPDLLTIRPGTLDDHSWLHPVAHIWTSSAQPWVEIPANVLQYEENPDDVLDLVRAWKTRSSE